MPFVADKEEASHILGRDLNDPVYRTIRKDDAGIEIAVPVFNIKRKGGKKEHPQKRCKVILLSIIGVTMIMVLIWLMILLAVGLTAHADGPGYECVEQTEDQEVIALTEEVAEIYPICPEMLQAIVFFESSNRRTVISRWGDIGYMQINPKWHQVRMDKLGIADLMDGYSNILIGADYLCELFAEYEDPALVLMCYNLGTEKATQLYDTGQINDYAKNILELSEKLERLHGK